MEQRKPDWNNGQRKQLNLLHTADLHMGSDIYPADADWGFNAILETARKNRVDAVLIAGDLFDAKRIPLETMSHVFDSLADLACPVVILPGNHDTLLTSPSSLPYSLPSHVHVLRDPEGELVTIEPLGLSVWGRPVYDHAPEFRPLEGVKPRPHNGWYVVLGHGLVMDGDTFAGRSSPISLEELKQADCDYIALGHIHRFLDVTQGRAPAYYSGAPSGIRQPTAAIVELLPAAGVVVRAARL